MKSNRTIPFVAGMLVIVMVAGACASEDPVEESAPADGGVATTEVVVDGDTHEEEYAFGVPMDAAEASRVIEIIAKDDFSFDPKSIDVETGEVITFRVSNPGIFEHDFTIGDAPTQAEHDTEMAEMANMGGTMDEGNAMSIPPGETKELTWMFTGSENLLFGCHIPGHYAKGMVGTFAITS